MQPPINILIFYSQKNSDLKFHLENKLNSIKENNEINNFSFKEINEIDNKDNYYTFFKEYKIQLILLTHEFAKSNFFKTNLFKEMIKNNFKNVIYFSSIKYDIISSSTLPPEINSGNSIPQWSLAVRQGNKDSYFWEDVCDSILKIVSSYNKKIIVFKNPVEKETINSINDNIKVNISSNKYMPSYVKNHVYGILNKENEETTNHVIILLGRLNSLYKNKDIIDEISFEKETKNIIDSITNL